MRTVILLAATLACFSAVQGRLLWGGCSKPTLKSNFDVSQYDGLWYEIRRDAKTSFEKGGTCVTAQYTLNNDNTITVLNSQTKKGVRDSITGKASCNGANCGVKFNWYIPKGDYRVVDTDYTNYAIVYSCEDYFNIFKTEYLWVLARSNTYDPTSQLSALQSTLPKYDQARLYATPQGGSCVY
jgi:apolipoprotein D and lipocalin family protein